MMIVPSLHRLQGPLRPQEVKTRFPPGGLDSQSLIHNGRWISSILILSDFSGILIIIYRCFMAATTLLLSTSIHSVGNESMEKSAIATMRESHNGVACSVANTSIDDKSVGAIAVDEGPVLMVDQVRGHTFNILLIVSCVAFASSQFLFGFDNVVISPILALPPFVSISRIEWQYSSRLIM